MEKPFIVGILNTTPDSYYDGGRYRGVETVLKRTEAMLAEGADSVEIGGESTGPRSVEVSLEEELERTIPFIRGIKKAFPKAVLSIDTWKAEVAEAAIREGASMVNDVTAGRGSADAMFSVVAQLSASLVLMYAKDPTPRTTIDPRAYDDLPGAIAAFLEARRDRAVAMGVDSSRIILDPGLGHFVSSDASSSFRVLAAIPQFLKLGHPILVSPSRKSFLAGSENLPALDRLPGTIAASAIAVLHGATYIRTHDVASVRRACEIAASIAAWNNVQCVTAPPAPQN